MINQYVLKSLLGLSLLTIWSAASAQLDFSVCPNGAVAQKLIGTANLPIWRNDRSLGPPMIRVTFTDDEAVCNDGSPGIMYLRPASSEKSANKWIIHIKGGGGCTSAESCYQRWCALPSQAGTLPNILDKPSLMSSNWTPDMTVGKGIQSTHMDNAFADWNHVLLHYCSSDYWLGDSEKTLAQPSLANGALLPKLDLKFRGARIIETAFTTLLDGRDGVKELEILANMPSLASASHVIISGDSAGSVGVISHLDRVASWISNGTTIPPPLIIEHTNPPEAVVLGVIDATAAPSLDDPLFVWPAGTSYEAHIQAYAANLRSFWNVQQPSLDDSCTRFSGNTDLCYDSMLTLKNHVATPVFVRNDLYDEVVGEMFFDLGLVSTELDMAEATSRGLLDLLPTTGTKRRRTNARFVFGPLCEKHIAITNDLRYLNEQVAEGGNPLSTTIADWATSCFSPTGCQSQALVASDNGPEADIFDPIPPSVCP